MIGTFLRAARQSPKYTLYKADRSHAEFPSAGSTVESRDDVNICRHAGLFLGLDMALETEGLEPSDFSIPCLPVIFCRGLRSFLPFALKLITLKSRAILRRVIAFGAGG